MTELAIRDEKGAIQLLLDLERAGAIDEVSLTLTDASMPYSRWEDLGRFFGSIERRSLWYVGDWLIFGEAVFGEAAAQGVEATTTERYSEAERVTGLAHGTLMNARSICASIARPRRRKELGFWIHGEVAKLDPADQERWLERAVTEGMSKQDLRLAIREALNPPPEDEGAELRDVDAADPPPVSLAERQAEVLSLVVRTAQPTSDGDYIVTAEIMAQARAALGED